MACLPVSQHPSTITIQDIRGWLLGVVMISLTEGRGEVHEGDLAGGFVCRQQLFDEGGPHVRHAVDPELPLCLLSGPYLCKGEATIGADESGRPYSTYGRLLSGVVCCKDIG